VKLLCAPSAAFLTRKGIPNIDRLHWHCRPGRWEIPTGIPVTDRAQRSCATGDGLIPGRTQLQQPRALWLDYLAGEVKLLAVFALVARARGRTAGNSLSLSRPVAEQGLPVTVRALYH
jgi:hypothetical protein